jgi:ABC-type dipeptide/oligopeptide/nickel transport system ATPase subunit
VSGTEPPVLRVDGVSHAYGRGGRASTVLRDIGFELRAGRTLAVVGESGAGKSTLARLVAGLERPTAGTILVGGKPARIEAGTVSPVQMVFQHPGEALNRFIGVGTSIAEPLRSRGRAERGARVAELLEQVGIDPGRARDRPSAFSGGQLQRVVIARALAGEPRLLLCDEPTSALDVSVQAQIVNLLLDLQADDVLVLRAGRMVELSPADRFFEQPQAEYSGGLLTTTAAQMLARLPAGR